jgi:hypothetical protein
MDGDKDLIVPQASAVNQLIAYARVSTTVQDLALQRAAYPADCSLAAASAGAPAGVWPASW